MRRPGCLLFLCVSAMATLILSGCEWEGAGDSGSWDSSTNWPSVSGVYTPAGGAAYLVSAYAPSSATPAGLTTTSQTLGTGDGANVSFMGTLSALPVSAGTMTITTLTLVNGTNTVNTLTDSGGVLSGTVGGHGTINYNTGIITLDLTGYPPINGDSVVVTYQYSVQGTTQSPEPGTAVPIYSLTVNQTGDKLLFTDNNGAQYSGQFTSVDGNFQVSGNEVNGEGFKIVGYFATGLMKGTWIEANGQTGEINGQLN